MRAVIESLLDLQNVLFHGSPVPDLNRLEPRRAVDVNGDNLFNNDEAVFASSHLCYAIIFGLVDPAAIKTKYPGPFSWAAHSVSFPDRIEVKAKLPHHVRSHLENVTGFVYVLARDDFSESSVIQYKSKQHVTPVAVYPVTLQDFYDLGGVVEWTDPDGSFVNKP